MNNSYRTTLISDLPELQDINISSSAGVGQYNESNILPEHAQKYKKYIRNSPNSMPEQAGMVPYGGGNPNQPHQPHQPPPFQQDFNQNPVNVQYNQPQQQEEYIEKPHIIEKYRTGPTCIDIADHVKDCPICSKFYNNNNAPYLIVIAVLAIICILLLKRVLNL